MPLKATGFHYNKIGMDPEFEMFGPRGAILPGADIMGGHLEWGGIGYDGGGGSSAEFRPKANASPAELINNLHQLFKQFKIMNTGRQLGVKGDRYPLGSHIHFGFREGREAAESEYCTNFLMLLDYFLGKPFLDLSGEARGAYKRLTTNRSQNWGIEYRPLPSAIFINRDIASAVFEAAHKVAKLYWNTDSGIDMPVAQLRGMAYRTEYHDLLGLSNTISDLLFDFPREYVKMTNADRFLDNWPEMLITQPRAPMSATEAAASIGINIPAPSPGDPFGPVTIPPAPVTNTPANTASFRDLGNGIRVRFSGDWDAARKDAVINRLRRSRVGREHPIFLTFHSLSNEEARVTTPNGGTQAWGFSFYSNGRSYTPNSRAEQYGPEEHQRLHLVRHNYMATMDRREIAIGCPNGFCGTTPWNDEERVGCMNSIVRIIGLVNWMIRQGR